MQRCYTSRLSFQHVIEKKLRYICLITLNVGTLIVVRRFYGRRGGSSNQLTVVVAGSGPVRDVVEHAVHVVTQKQMVSKTSRSRVYLLMWISDSRH